MPEFDRSAPVTVSLHVQRGIADVFAEERTTIQVEVKAEDGTDATDRFQIGLEGDTLYVHAPEWPAWQWRRTPKLHVTVRVPLDSSLAAKSAAADVRAMGRYRTAHTNVASGNAYLEWVSGDAHLKAASGDLTADRVGGSLRISSSSGELHVGDVTGDVNADTASGNITIRKAEASLEASTASGDVEIGSVSRGRARVRSASGDVAVGVAAGTGVWLDLNTASGKTSSDLSLGGRPAMTEQQATLELRIRTASGDIDIHRSLGETPAVSRPA